MLLAGMLATASAESAPSGNGWFATYFRDRDLRLPVVSRVDPAIDFDWAAGSPADGVPVDDFSVRWLGWFTPRFSEATTLTARADDGVRVWVDGELVIDSWIATSAVDRTYTFDAVAGHAYLVRVEFEEFGGVAEARLGWSSASQPTTNDPTQVAPFADFSIAIPATSSVSPAFIEGAYAQGRQPTATVDDAALPVAALSDVGFDADVPLDPTHAVAVAVADGSVTVTGAIAWQPTAVVGTAATAIRRGDALLFAAGGDGTWDITTSSGIESTARTVAAGDQWPYRFDRPGQYALVLRSGAGEQIGRVDITVVDVGFEAAPIACAVGFERHVDGLVVPGGIQPWFEGNDRSLASVRAMIAADGTTDLLVTPWRRGSPAITARLFPHGPVIRSQSIDEFTFTVPALARSVVDADTGIGSTTLTMHPYIPHVDFAFNMFAHTSSFYGGAKSFTVDTSAATSSLGERGFRTRPQADDEDAGEFTFRIEVPVDESKYCFSVQSSQLEQPIAGDLTSWQPGTNAVLLGWVAPWPMPLLDPLLVLATAGSSTPTSSSTNVNGDVCHVHCYKSLVFTKAQSAEDEVSDSSNPELWDSRSWTLVSAEFCDKGDRGDGDCSPVSYLLHVEPPSGDSSAVDDPRPALFAASRTDSDCKPCDGACDPVTPDMDTGTIPAHYNTTVVVCSTGNGDVLGSSAGGEFWISKLDAHGLGGDRMKFPLYAYTLKRRPGSVADPVIQMDTGGDQSIEGCSLYGWTNVRCPPMNHWEFTVVARDPLTQENLPAGYSVKWRLSNFDPQTPSEQEIPGLTVIGTKDGQPERVAVDFPVGRWFPRVEIWFTDPNPPEGTTAQPELFSVAEIHSIVVEPFPGDNVAPPNGPVSEPQRYGQRFELTNHAGGLTVDARVRVEVGRGRVSLDGYPQNQYWVHGPDDTDLPQILPVPDGSPVVCWMQGYLDYSQSQRDHTLLVEGQAQLETCQHCNLFRGSPAQYVWQDTDRERFTAYDVQPKSVDADGKPTTSDGVPASVPGPLISLGSASLRLRDGLTGDLELSGTIRSGTCDMIPDDSGKITSVQVCLGTAQSAIGSLSVDGSKGDQPDNLRRRYPFDGSFGGTVSAYGLALGANVVTLIATEPLHGHQGRHQFLVDVEPVGALTPAPDGPLADTTELAQPLALRVNASNLGALRDLIGLRDPVAATTSGGAVLVLDAQLARVLRITAGGVIGRRWGDAGSGAGGLDGPSAIAAISGHAAIVDLAGTRLQAFDATTGALLAAAAPSATPVRRIAAWNGGFLTFVADSASVARWSDLLAPEGDLALPIAIGTDDAVGVTGNRLWIATADRRLLEIALPSALLQHTVDLSGVVSTDDLPHSVVASAGAVDIVYASGLVIQVTGAVATPLGSAPGPVAAAALDGQGRLKAVIGGDVVTVDLATLAEVGRTTSADDGVRVRVTPLVGTAFTDATLTVSGDAAVVLQLAAHDTFRITVPEAALISADAVTGIRTLPVSVDYPEWGLAGRGFVLTEETPGSGIFTIGLSTAVVRFAADLSQMTLRLDGAAPITLDRTADDPATYRSAGAAWNAVVTMPGGAVDPTRTDAVTVAITSASLPAGALTVDLLETGPASLRFTTAALRRSTGVVGGGGYRAAVTETTFHNGIEEVTPVAFAILGIDESRTVIPVAEIDLPTLDGPKRAIKFPGDGHYYLGRDDRDDPAIYLGSPKDAYVSP